MLLMLNLLVLRLFSSTVRVSEFLEEVLLSISVLPYFLVQYPLEQIPSTKIRSLAEFVCVFMLQPQTNFTFIYEIIYQLS